MIHTQEEWKVRLIPDVCKPPDTTSIYIDAPTFTIAEVRIKSSLKEHQDEAIANAQLMATAPKMYELLKSFSFMPDCGGDFCFLATEEMENECEEPEEGITGDCKHKGYCRWANAFMIKRDKVLAEAEGKE